MSEHYITFTEVNLICAYLGSSTYLIAFIFFYFFLKRNRRKMALIKSLLLLLPLHILSILLFIIWPAENIIFSVFWLPAVVSLLILIAFLKLRH